MNEVIVYIVNLNNFNYSKEYTNNNDKQKEISRYLKTKYIDEVITYNDYGKPIAKDIFLNVSHSNERVVMAVAKKEVGVDIEYIKPSMKSHLHKMFSEEELKEIKTPKDFYSLWTRKESLLKCVGTGITQELKTVPTETSKVLTFNNKKYITKSLDLGDYYLSVTLETTLYFAIKLIELSF